MDARLRKITGFIINVIGVHPDEYGLIPDEEGYFRIRDLMKVMQEEEGFSHVRKQVLNEILLNPGDPPFETDDSRIRAINKRNLPVFAPDPDPPLLLFSCVRKKAHQAVMENGLTPSTHKYVVLSDDRDLAMRRGRRIDPDPVLITVHTDACIKRGLFFHRFCTRLYTTEAIPADCLSAPLVSPKAVARKKEEARRQAEKNKKTQQSDPRMAGSFLLEGFGEEKEEKPFEKGKSKKDKIFRDREKKKARRKKEKEKWGG